MTPTDSQFIDGPFLARHLWLPLLFAAAILAVFEFTPLDVALERTWFSLQGGAWALRDHWVTYELAHHWGTRLIILVVLALVACFAASFRSGRLRPWRWSLGLSIAGAVLLPAVCTFLKNQGHVPCPWDIDQFGGVMAYEHTLQALLHGNAGHCYPAGHSSGGFGLLIIYFAFAPFNPGKRSYLLLPGLLLGGVFAMAQELRGAHFLSHDLSSAAICWFGGLFLYLAALKWFPPRGRAGAAG